MIDVFIIHRARSEVVDFKVNFLFQKSSARHFSGKFQKFFKIFFGQKSDVHHARENASRRKIHEVLTPLGIAQIQ
jgi:hypothetical protein